MVKSSKSSIVFNSTFMLSPINYINPMPHIVVSLQQQMLPSKTRKDNNSFDQLTSLITYLKAVREYSSRNFFKNLWSFEIALKRKNKDMRTAKMALQTHRRNLKERLGKMAKVCSRTSNVLANRNPKQQKQGNLNSQPLYKVVLDIDLQDDSHEFSATCPPFSKSPETYHKDWQTTILKLAKRHITKSLIINQCRIDLEIVRFITTHLKTTLRELWLGDNVIGDDGAIMIVQTVRKLQLLSLAANRITDVGAMGIVKWATPELKVLKLKQNQISEDSAIALAVCLCHLQRLQVDPVNQQCASTNLMMKALMMSV